MNVRFFVSALAVVGSITACSSSDSPAPSPAPASSSTPPASNPTPDDAAAPPQPGGEVKVVVKNFGFDPPTVTIKVGQTVEWDWTSGAHNVVSGGGCTSDGKFSSGAVTSAPSTFKHTFDGAGTFDYFCDPHCSLGMVGKVIVE